MQLREASPPNLPTHSETIPTYDERIGKKKVSFVFTSLSPTHAHDIAHSFHGKPISQYCEGVCCRESCDDNCDASSLGTSSASC